jgi:hypothetical protein
VLILTYVTGSQTVRNDKEPTVEQPWIDCGRSLPTAEDYRSLIARLRAQLRDEGKDAVDPGHSSGANDVKFSIECIEQLIACLPHPDSVQRVVVCSDAATGENVAFAVVTRGSGGPSVRVREWNVQTIGIALERIPRSSPSTSDRSCS